jgi:hypothetical protein
MALPDKSPVMASLIVMRRLLSIWCRNGGPSTKPLEADRNGLWFGDGTVLQYSALPQLAKALIYKFVSSIKDCLKDLPLQHHQVLSSQLVFDPTIAPGSSARVIVDGDPEPGLHLLVAMLRRCGDPRSYSRGSLLKRWLKENGNVLSTIMGECLMVLGGGLGRCSEVVHALERSDGHINTTALSRTLIPMANGTVMYRLYNNKSYTIQVRQQGVARYLSKSVAQLFAIYLAYIRPWHQICSAIALLPDDVLSSVPFGTLVEQYRLGKLDYGGGSSFRVHEIQTYLLLYNGSRMTAAHLREQLSRDMSDAATEALKQGTPGAAAAAVQTGVREWRQLCARSFVNWIVPQSQARASEILRTQPDATIGLLSSSPDFLNLIAGQLTVPFIRQFGHSVQTHLQSYDGVDSLSNVAEGCSSIFSDRDLTGGSRASQLVHEAYGIHQDLASFWNDGEDFSTIRLELISSVVPPLQGQWTPTLNPILSLQPGNVIT